MDAYNKHIASNPKVEFIHVSMDDSRKKARKWAKSAKFPWLHVLQSKAKKTGLLTYAKGFVPQYCLIDKDGKVITEGKMAAFAKIRQLAK